MERKDECKALRCHAVDYQVDHIKPSGNIWKVRAAQGVNEKKTVGEQPLNT